MTNTVKPRKREGITLHLNGHIWHRRLTTRRQWQENVAYRLALQVREESEKAEVYCGLVDPPDWEVVRKWMQRNAMRYKALPQPGGGRLLLVALTRHPRTPTMVALCLLQRVVRDWKELPQWLMGYIRSIPSRSRVTGSRGFGGRYAGSRDTPLGCKRVPFSVPSVARLLASNGVSFARSKRSALALVVRPEDRERVATLLAEEKSNIFREHDDGMPTHEQLSLMHEISLVEKVS